jgi:hypothetical protein
LPEYYFDIETAPLPQYRNLKGASFDPCRSKIITIQYQKLDNNTGLPLGELVILKEWTVGSSEEAIVGEFKKVFIDRGIWGFIPVGNNLVMECKFMKNKLKQYCGLEGLKLGQRPMIDLKHVLVIANNGSFKGYQHFLSKFGLAENIAGWYYDRNWSLIENYVIKEARDFVRVYSLIKKELPKILL